MRRKKIISIGLFLFMILLFPKHASADVVFSVAKSADNLKPGQEVTITIKASVPQNSQLEAYSLYFKPIDSNGNNPLTYISGNGADGVNISQSGTNIAINYTGAGINSNLNPVATMQYRVNDNVSAGNVTLKLDMASKCTSATSCSAKSINLALSALGSDASLKSLSIPNSTLSPAFSKDTYEYTANVKDVSEVTVKAAAADSSSKIQISDNYKSLQKGNNLIKIVVTAENGASKTYSINVNLTTTPTDAELLKSDATLTELKIKDFKIDFSSDEKKYFLEVPNKIKKLNITTKTKNENATVKLDNPKLKIGKNTITITVTSEDKTKTDSYQIIVTRAEAKKKMVQTCPDVTSTKEWIIYYVTIFVVFSLGIVLGYLLCKKDVLKKLFKKKDKKKKEKKDKEDTLSDTIELDTTKVLEKARKK